VRSHSKASTAGARRRKPALFAVVLAATLIVSALLVAAASGAISVVTEPPTSNTGVRATLAGTVNPDGVELDECFFEWGRLISEGGEGVEENTVPCAQTPAAIGAGTDPVAVDASIDGLIPHEAGYVYRLVAVDTAGRTEGSNFTFFTPDIAIAETASDVTSTGATLNGTVNPDGTALTECVFEWGLEKNVQDPVQTYSDSAPCVPGPGGIGAGTSPVAVQAAASGMQPGTRYAFRIKAANANGPFFSDPVVVQAAGPAIVAAWAESVTRNQAILKAEINPEGEATTYRFEYGTSTAYGSETPELPVGSDSSPHVVAQLLAGLQPDTTYHYRVVATNGAAQSISEDRTFTTFTPITPRTDCPNQAYRYGPGANLPDCRAYELVSPLDKNGSNASEFTSRRFEVAVTQAAIDGNGLTFSAANSFGDAVSAPLVSQYLSTRGTDDWFTRSLNAPKIGPDVGSFSAQGAGPYKHFSPDLGTSYMVHFSDPLVPGVPSGVPSLYRRDNSDGSYLPLTLGEPSHTSWDPDVQGFSEDESHVVFALNDAIGDDAPALGEVPQLYEWVNGEVNLVSVLPNGEPAMSRSSLGGWLDRGISYDSHITGAEHAISDDGSTIFWTLATGSQQGGTIYARLNGAETIPVSETATSDLSHFWAASADGSAAIFEVVSGAQAGDLYEFDVATETSTLIAHNSFGLIGTADDLSRVYFTSRDVLDTGATAGAPNLYVRNGDAIAFIATLSRFDAGEGTGFSVMGAVSPYPALQTAQVSANGRYALFTSDRSLTGYDNVDVDLKKPVTEVYRYDAVAGELVCVSCNPSGARPKNGFEEAGSNDSIRVWVDAWVPAASKQTYARRIMSADGSRVFFNTRSPLVPGDANGTVDVYQWQEQGSGTCDEPQGCVDLISNGTNPRGAKFFDASPSGNDVFFVTYASIDPRDPGLVDVYDARVNGGLVLPPAPPGPCVGDSCQAAPPAPLDQTPASASFRGAGDPVLRASCGSLRTRAARLARRAGRLDREARQSSSPDRAAKLRRRAAALRQEGKSLKRRAVRCRNARRRAGR
jgi:hypothetical protein